MRTSIRAAGAALAALALVHCAPPPPPVDAGSDVASRPDAVADTGVRPDAAGASSAGAACADDTMCNGLTCDTSVQGGMCSSTCTNNASQANEQSQCGGTGSTCMSIGDGAEANSFCTKACRASTATSCRAGFICTGFWYTHEGATPDTAGCFPFCSDNAHCGMGEVCNVRTGSCQTGAINPALLADGEPCTVPAMGAASPCRGICFRTSDRATDPGTCGSFINLSTTTECRDNPEVVLPLGRMGTDNLGICLFRQCDATRCCPNRHVCEPNMPGDTEGTCGVDDPMTANIACNPGAGDGGTDGGSSPDASAPDAAPDAAADVVTGG